MIKQTQVQMGVNATMISVKIRDRMNKLMRRRNMAESGGESVFDINGIVAAYTEQPIDKGCQIRVSRGVWR